MQCNARRLGAAPRMQKMHKDHLSLVFETYRLDDRHPMIAKAAKSNLQQALKSQGHAHGFADTSVAADGCD
jgi:hypothetical protein